MNARAKLGLAAFLLISVGFGLGWLARGRVSRTVESPSVPSSGSPQQSEHSSTRVVVSVDGVPVLRFEGTTLDAALGAGNKQTHSKALADNVKPDAKNP